MKKDSGYLVETADFEVAEDEVIDRFLSHLDGHQAEAVRLLAILDSFDQSFFGSLLKRFNIAIPVTWFDDFCAISYAESVETAGAGIFKIHECFRDHLRGDVKSTTCGQIFEIAYVEARRSTEEGDFLRASRMLRSALPALSQGITTIGADSFSEILDVCFSIADSGYVSEVAQIASKLTTLPQSETSVTVGQFVLAYCHRRCGRLVEAKKSYASINQSLFSVVLPSQQLRLRFHAAQVDHLLGRYAEAACEYKAIVSTSAKRTEEIVAHNFALRQLADIHLIQGDFKTALRELDELLEYSAPNPVWSLECLRFRGHVLRFNFLISDAVATYAGVLKGSGASRIPGMRAKALVNLAEARCWNQPGQAIHDAEEGISLADSTGNVIEVGKGHTAAAIACIFLGGNEGALKHLSAARSFQTDAGYQSGNVFVTCAFALYHFLLDDTQQLVSTVRLIEQQTSVLGAYRFLAWIYATICEVKTLVSGNEFHWLPNSNITETLAAVRQRLLLQRS